MGTFSIVNSPGEFSSELYQGPLEDDLNLEVTLGAALLYFKMVLHHIL